MASLDTLHRWTKFAPDIGNNRDLPAGEQLLLEVAAGLPKTALTALADALREAADDAARIEALSRYVRLVGGPHTLGGVQVATLKDYFDIVAGLAGGYNLRELFAAVGHFNSFAEADAVFSERRSGGTAFMPPRSAARDGDETGGR
jgi:adenylosuccinate lyase